MAERKPPPGEGAHRLWVWGLLLGAFGLGLLLVSANGDDSKWTSFGAQLSAATAVGAVLAIFGHHVTQRFQEEQRQTRATTARLPTGAVQQDDPDRNGAQAPDPKTSPPPTESVAPSAPNTELNVEVESWGTDTTRIDADQLRLRTYKDDDYFQFFTVVVPGPLFRVAVHQPGSFTLQQFQHGVLDLSLREIRRAVDSNSVPLSNPTKAYELFPDLDEAAKLARGKPDEPLPTDRQPVP